MRNNYKPWFDDQCRHAIGLKQEAHFRLTGDRSRINWEEFIRCQVRADETYLEAKRRFSHRVDSVIESSVREIIGSKNFALNNLSINFCETRMYNNKYF